MAEQSLSSVFLSASVPDPERDAKYYKTGNVVYIREAVRAVAEGVLPRARLVFGGHPAITPFIRAAARNVGHEDRVKVFQTRYFGGPDATELGELSDVVWTDAIEGDCDGSLLVMRDAMLDDDTIVAGVFIGGMEGVEDEFDLFRKRHRDRPALPIPTTGAAALALFEAHDLRLDPDLTEALAEDIVYDALVQRWLCPLLTPPERTERPHLLA